MSLASVGLVSAAVVPGGAVSGFGLAFGLGGWVLLYDGKLCDEALLGGRKVWDKMLGDGIFGGTGGDDGFRPKPNGTLGGSLFGSGSGGGACAGGGGGGGVVFGKNSSSAARWAGAVEGGSMLYDVLGVDRSVMKVVAVDRALSCPQRAEGALAGDGGVTGML
jgi:hypothetical protein